MRSAAVTSRVDETWVRAAYAAYGSELYRFALRSLGDRGLAEEAVQDTFLKAWKAYERFDGDLGSERTWLFAIIRNTIIDLARARGVRPPLPHGTTIDEQTSSIEAQVDQMIEVWLVEEALARLSEEHRRALVSVHISGQDYETVAAELGIPTGTLKSRVYYGLKALRLVLDELGWSEDE